MKSYGCWEGTGVLSSMLLVELLSAHGTHPGPRPVHWYVVVLLDYVAALGCLALALYLVERN